MIIELYKNLSSDNTINKNLEKVGELNITLRGDFNPSNPTIRLRAKNEYPYFNYIKIVGLSKYYFVKSSDLTSSEIITINCSIDVLESFKSEIMNCSARVMRRIKTGDSLAFQVDELVNPVISRYDSTEGFSGEPSIILSTLG